MIQSTHGGIRRWRGIHQGHSQHQEPVVENTNVSLLDDIDGTL
mgnify:FL=1|jgi:hypothetical protein